MNVTIFQLIGFTLGLFIPLMFYRLMRRN